MKIVPVAASLGLLGLAAVANADAIYDFSYVGYLDEDLTMAAPMGDHLEDHFALPIRELGPQPDHLPQALVLHRGCASIGDTLDGIATNRLSRYRGVGVLARFQRECRAFESPHPLSNPCLDVRPLAGDSRRMNPASRRGFSLVLRRLSPSTFRLLTTVQ
jgi:hypothetical protein